MFSKSARWYDALYSFKDYQEESGKIINLIKKEHPGAKTILDIACGTAEHDRYLAKKYHVDGLDIHSEFVELSSQKNPAGRYFLADMRDFSLGKTYDVVLCLFSSIGYVKTLRNVVKTLRCFRNHLNQGGIIVVEPWFTPKNWITDMPIHMLTADTPDFKVCRMNISQRKGSLSILIFHYLVGMDREIVYFTERHELGLFTVDQMTNAFQEAGLQVSYGPEGLTGRGLYVARLF